jgi:hypothetical protein
MIELTRDPYQVEIFETMLRNQHNFEHLLNNTERSISSINRILRH